MSEQDKNTNEINCYACHKKLDIEPTAKIVKNEECDYCYASLHCCRMCEYYKPSAYNECRESNAERILEKEKANFCEYFVLKGGEIDKEKEKTDLISAANSLFKD